jgi:tRNA pseudouridine55 synthase
MHEHQGFLLINKPAGASSYDCIRRLQKILGIKKRIGHAGTLDPFATGLLIVAIGRQATKHIQKIMELDKEYVATGKLGILTDTLDLTGAEIEECPVPDFADQKQISLFRSSRSLEEQKLNLSLFRIPASLKTSGRTGNSIHTDKNSILCKLEHFYSPEQKALAMALKAFTPSYIQTPPVFSALRHQGSRLYNLARRETITFDELNEIAVQKQRIVQIYQLEILDVNLPLFTIRARVSHGTYIRSLVNDIARALGSCATTIALERSSIGPFALTNAFELEKIKEKADLLPFLISVEEFLGVITRQEPCD